MIKIIETSSGRQYELSTLSRGNQQYMDRAYQFAYIPKELSGLPLVMTCGKDKMISEDSFCFSLSVDNPSEVYVLFADKHTDIPAWLEEYQRIRMNITRMDSNPETLKGYFSVYKKTFPAGVIRFNGNSSRKMLSVPSYIETRGTDYCMYSVVINELL